jgi:hypothetical protein
MLVMVALIHLLPVSGVVSADRLAVLYGLSFEEVNLEILMRHRAVLFGILGVFLCYSAFKPRLFLSGLSAAFVSVISFLYIAWSVGGYNSEIGRVFVADVFALICILIGLVAYLLGPGRQNSVE